jgi:uncharacterized membrane protein SirB2
MPIVVLAWAVISDDPTAMDKVKLFFDMFSQLPSWFTNLWILVVASIYGIKGTQIFKDNKNNMEISMNYYFTGALIILFVAFAMLVAQ